MIKHVQVGRKSKLLNRAGPIPIFCLVIALIAPYIPTLITIILILLCFYYTILVMYSLTPVIISKISKRKNEHLSLEELNKLYPYLTKVGICGLGSVGKSTLVESMTLSNPKNQSTQLVTAKICEYRNERNRFYALLDGRGQNFAHQADIVRKSEFLICMIDHNPIDNNVEILEERISETENFLGSILSIIETETPENKPIDICFVTNKKDLWSQNVESEINSFKKRVKSIINSFIGVYLQENIFSYELNSKDAPQVADFLSFLKV